ncbi:hypothetical protein [Thermoflexus hugenholtzii]
MRQLRQGGLTFLLAGIFLALLIGAMGILSDAPVPVARAQGIGVITHTRVADFAVVCAISTGISIGNAEGGELHLTASVEDDFDGTAIDGARWVISISNPAAGPYQAITLANGLVSLDGMYLRSVLTMTQLPRFFEARARLMRVSNTSGEPDLGFYREVGPAYNPFTPTSSIRLFILGNGDINNLIVRARDGDGPIADVDIPDPDETQFHVFRIEWEPEATRYYINGVLQTTIPSPTLVVTSWVFLYHQTPSYYGSTPTDIDWVRAGQYVGNGTYTSCPQDAGQKVRWDTLAWNAVMPPGTTLLFRVRTSADGVTWSNWSDPLPAGPNNIPSTLAFARYLQYRVEMSTTNPMQSPEVQEVVLRYSELADLVVSKSASSDTVLAGNELTYTVRITNNGPLPAQNVRVTDTLPGGVTWITSTPSQGECATLTCNLGTLNPGGVATVNIRVRVNSNTLEGTLANQVIVGTDTPDDPANNTATVPTAVQTQADLSLTLRDEPDPVVAGTLLTYTLTLTNAGPSDARGVQVTLTLPSGLTVLSLFPSQGSCAGTTCTLGDVPADGIAILLLRARVNSSTPAGNLTLSAQASASTPDPNPANNTASETTTVQTQADLALTLQDEPDPVVAGTLLTYTLTLANTGPSDAQSVAVDLALPDGVMPIASIPSQGTCADTTCTLGTLLAGNIARITVTTRVNSRILPGTTLSAIAQATSTTSDPNTVNNTATAFTTVQTQADLSLTLQDEPDPVVAGSLLTYTLTLTNTGPSDTRGVQVTLTLPGGLTVLDLSPSQGSCAGTTCTLGDVSADGTATLLLRARVNSSTPAGNLTLSAQASATTPDPNLDNNTASETTTVQTQADLALTLQDEPDPVVAGTLLTYTLTLANTGPSDAQSVAVNLALPDGVTPIAWIPSQGSCADTTCTLGVLPAGNIARITVTTRVNSNIPTGTILSAIAQATSPTSDPNTANNTATAFTTVQTQADLSLTIRDEPDPVVAGDLLTYTLTLTNIGPSDARGVQVTLTLPGGLTLLGLSPSQGSCGTSTCALGDVPAGGTATLLLRARVNPSTPAGNLTLSAQASATTPDPNLDNNTASETTAVQTQADLALTLQDEPDPVVAGDLLTYTLTLTNTGPSDAQGVVLTLTLPISWQVDGFTPISGCNLDGNRIICDMGTMPAEAVQTLLVTGTVPAEVPEGTVLIAQAEVRAETPDASSENNEALASTEVRGEADLQVFFSGEPDLVFVGEVVTYTLALTNAGPSLAPGVQVTFTLPNGVQVLDATPSSGSCAEASCALGDLPVGENATVRLRVRVERWTSPEIRVRVEAVSRAVDPTPASAEVRTQVRLRLFLPLVMRGG